MVVQHNISALNANRQLGIVENNLSKSTEKLSSGYKVNRAADDAAGLSISEKMRKQIRGLTQAAENIQDGISLCQVADGALTEVHDMLQRMNELSVQAANGTNSNSDRNAVDNEFQQLLTEIDRVGLTTEFNDQRVFEYENTISNSLDIKSDNTSPIISNYQYVTYDSNDMVAGEEIYEVNRTEGFLDSDFGRYRVSFVVGNDYDNPSKMGKAISVLHLEKEAEYIMISFRIDGDKAYLDMRQTDLDSRPTTPTSGDYLHMSRDNVPPVQLNLAIGTCTANSDSSYTLDFGDYGHITFWSEKGEDVVSAINKNAVVFNCGVRTRQGSVVPIDKYKQPSLPTTNNNGNHNIPSGNGQVTDKTWWIQTGAECGEGMHIHTGKLSRKALNLESVDISTEANATAAIDSISDAISKISAQRSRIGAEQNRLESAKRIDDNVVENTTAAESKIRDTDMATEMVRHSKYNILAQAGQSMLAQANQLNQGVLGIIQ